MTQFALARAKEKYIGLRNLIEVDDSFLSEMAVELFPGAPMRDIYMFDIDGEDIDSLMLDAQKVVSDGGDFQGTMLCKVVKGVAGNVDDLVFWYGSDYDDLDYVYDIPALLRMLKDAVSDSICEAYIYYNRKERERERGQ